MHNLRDKGNTLVVVEHDEAVMHQADQLIDMGPEAGEHGGEITYQGPAKTNSKKRSLTLQYLSGQQSISIPSKLRNRGPIFQSKRLQQIIFPTCHSIFLSAYSAV
jgi:excinuclease ABC subunit A